MVICSINSVARQEILAPFQATDVHVREIAGRWCVGIVSTHREL